MSSNNNATIPTPRFANAPWYSIYGLVGEMAPEAIRRFSEVLWYIADASTRGPTILRVHNLEHFHPIARSLILLMAHAPWTEFHSQMLSAQNENERQMTERALNAMHPENVAIWFADAGRWRWVELNVPSEKTE